MLGLVVALTPVTANAQSSYAHRQKTKNDWRNIAIGSGALGALGLLTKNGTLTTLGLAGAGYSAYRYEQDRRSQNSMKSRGYYYYGRPSSYRSYSSPYRSYSSNRYGNTRYYGSSYKSSKHHKHVPQGHAYGYWKKRGRC